MASVTSTPSSTKRRIRGMSIVELLVVTTVVGGAAAALLVRQAQIDRQQKVATAVNTISTIYDYVRSIAGVSRDFSNISSTTGIGSASELRVIAKNLKYVSLTPATDSYYTDGTFRYMFSGDSTSFSIKARVDDAALCASLAAALRETADYLYIASTLNFGTAPDLGNFSGVASAATVVQPGAVTPTAQTLATACSGGIPSAGGFVGVTYLNGQGTF